MSEIGYDGYMTIEIAGGDAASHEGRDRPQPASIASSRARSRSSL